MHSSWFQSTTTQVADGWHFDVLRIKLTVDTIQMQPILTMSQLFRCHDFIIAKDRLSTD